MKRTIGWVAGVALILFCAGCAGVKSVDEGADAERKRMLSTNEELRGEIKTLQTRYDLAQQTVTERENTIRELDAQIAGLKQDLSRQKIRTEEIQEALAKEKTRARLKDETIGDSKPRKTDVDRVPPGTNLREQRKEVREAAKTEKADTAVKRIRLKVLSGNGKIATAIRAAKQLAGLGYTVDKIDLAPRSNFRTSILYYAAGYEKEAQNLRNRIGSDLEMKPMTWTSEFPLILVSAK